MNAVLHAIPMNGAHAHVDAAKCLGKEAYRSQPQWQCWLLPKVEFRGRSAHGRPVVLLLCFA